MNNLGGLQSVASSCVNSTTSFGFSLLKFGGGWRGGSPKSFRGMVDWRSLDDQLIVTLFNLYPIVDVILGKSDACFATSLENIADA